MLLLDLFVAASILPGLEPCRTEVGVGRRVRQVHTSLFEFCSCSNCVHFLYCETATLKVAGPIFSLFYMARKGCMKVAFTCINNFSIQIEALRREQTT